MFPKVFRKPTKTIGKTKDTKDNQRTHNKTFGKTNKTKLLKVSDPPLDMDLLFFVCWCSLKFLQNQENLRENPKHQRTSTRHTKTLWKTNNNKVVKRFIPTIGYGFVFVVVVVGVPEGFYKTNKTFGNTNKKHKNNKKQQTHIQGWVCKLSKTLFVGFPEGFCWFLFVFFCMFGFPYCFFFGGGFSNKPSGKPQKQTHIQGWV